MELISIFSITHYRTSQSASYPSTMAIWEYVFPHKILKNQQVPQHGRRDTPYWIFIHQKRLPLQSPLG
jgi:hypothetical protein